MPINQFNFMHSFMTTLDDLNKALLETWRDNEMAEKHNFPKTAKEYIKQNSYAVYTVVASSDEFRGSYLMDVRDVRSMIGHYFNTEKPSEDLSAEDFVKAININLDMLIAGFADKEGDTASDLTKMMLEYTKKFINEFVETAVVKTGDEEKPEDSFEAIPSVQDIASGINTDINTMLSIPDNHNAMGDMMLAYAQKLVGEYADINIKSALIMSLDGIHPTELKHTIPFMDNDQYQLRFKAEYYQLKIRIDKLQNIVNRWDKGELHFTPTCPRSTYDLQLRAMKDYIAVLEMRAIMEGIRL